ncbi:MAG: hypothetical protein A2X58_08485 [Nitrospirae bacterium GWC2_56_14]|nr:MAG: hypothetical protein A2X58_08485 [Nitrospirae bacterium GWC2_56_14]
MKFIEYRGPFRLLIPHYDELVLFTMSLTCLLLLVTGVLSHMPEIATSSRQFDPGIFIPFIFIAIFMAGLILSLYHAFVDRPKTEIQKSFMLFFAVLINVFSGFMGSGYSLTTANGWFIVFPIINMINSMILLFMWRYGHFDESSISDQQASKGQVMLAGTMVLILFYLCHVVYEFIWIQTLSVCLVYSINFIRLIESLIFRPVPVSK